MQGSRPGVCRGDVHAMRLLRSGTDYRSIVSPPGSLDARPGPPWSRATASPTKRPTQCDQESDGRAGVPPKEQMQGRSVSGAGLDGPDRRLADRADDPGVRRRDGRGPPFGAEEPAMGPELLDAGFDAFGDVDALCLGQSDGVRQHVLARYRDLADD